jgi:dTMP kinase
MSGIFISFEGGEGAGKTTLIEELSSSLAQLHFKILKTREPGGTKLGEHIRSLLLQHKDLSISPRAELCLFLASRAQHVEEIILPALKAGKVVLCDRYNDSSLAYQGVARGLGIDEILPFCEFATSHLQPNLTLYLDLDPKIGLARALEHRKDTDRIESEKIAFHQKIREAYHLLEKKFPKRFRMIDASKSPKEVFNDAFAIVKEVMHV